MIASPSSDEIALESQLSSLGYHPLGPKSVVKRTGRSHLFNLQTSNGLLWIKHSYHLPPGEGAILGNLAERWQHHLPEIVCHSTYSIITKTLPGEELTEAHPLGDWTSAAHALGEIANAEKSQVDSWLALGVRDRRPDKWESVVLALRKSPTVATLDRQLLSRFDGFLPDFLDRYVDAFRSEPTLVPQDSGCCNIHITADGPIFYDWADVVVGHPVFSCDRLLDQTPSMYREEVIEAFCDPLNLSRNEFNAMRRSNVLHEVLRYHDELEFLEESDPQFQTLSAAVRSQLRVLIDFEYDKRKTT